MDSPATVSSTTKIDIDWLNERLKSTGKLKSEITSLKLETIGAGVGLMVNSGGSS